MIVISIVIQNHDYNYKRNHNYDYKHDCSQSCNYENIIR